VGQGRRKAAEAAEEANFLELSTDEVRWIFLSAIQATASLGSWADGHKEDCPNARHYRAEELEAQVWRFVHDLLTDPERMRAGFDAMIEEKAKALRGGPGEEANFWLDKIADIDRQRTRAQDLASLRANSRPFRAAGRD
jgi:hypothetical protein